MSWQICRAFANACHFPSSEFGRWVSEVHNWWLWSDVVLKMHPGSAVQGLILVPNSAYLEHTYLSSKRINFITRGPQCISNTCVSVSKIACYIYCVFHIKPSSCINSSYCHTERIKTMSWWEKNNVQGQKHSRDVLHCRTKMLPFCMPKQLVVREIFQICKIGLRNDDAANSIYLPRAKMSTLLIEYSVFLMESWAMFQ